MADQKRQCYLCRRNINDVNPKDTRVLQRFISSYGKIVPRRRSGVCAWHQRKLARAVKTARIMGLLPFVVS